MSSEDPGFDGTAAHGPAVLSVEKKWQRIMLSAGIQKPNLEKHFRTTPKTSPKTNNFAKCFDCGCLESCCFDCLAS
jgi:succinate dehydrogenase/fumarate reductase-like Fe-S protein